MMRTMTGPLVGLMAVLTLGASQVQAQDSRQAAQVAPFGVRVTPTAAAGARLESLNPQLPGLPDVRASHAATTAVSPDGQTLLVLTSGYNRIADPQGQRIAAASNEYVFVYALGPGGPRHAQQALRRLPSERGQQQL